MKEQDYVGRWLKALKYFSDEHNQRSLKPGDYIQIKEIVDGIGIGYKDGRKHLLFNTPHIDNYLSTNFELMPEDHFSKDKLLFTTTDGVEIFFGDTYWYIGKEWLGADKKSVIPVTINDKWDINKKAPVTYGKLQTAQNELIQKVYIVSNTEMGWDNIVFVTFDEAEARKCKNSWGDECVIHTKTIEDKYEEEW